MSIGNTGAQPHHTASETEIRLAIAGPCRAYECGPLNCTFIVNRILKTIVRAGILGGDVHNIEQGWVYGTNFETQLAEAEIYHLCATVKRASEDT